jgi:hypothetical protein
MEFYSFKNYLIFCNIPYMQKNYNILKHYDVIIYASSHEGMEAYLHTFLTPAALLPAGIE